MNRALAEYWGILRPRWRWVTWGILFALLAATTYLVVVPPLYRSDATVFVRTPGDVSTVLDGGDSYAQGRARTYAALAASTSLTSRVAADLGLDVTPDVMSRRIRAANPPGTALIRVSVSAPSAAEAQQTATVLLHEFTTMVRTLEQVPGSLVPRAELVIVDPPSPAARVVGSGASVPLVLLGAALAGLVLGALGAVLRSTLPGPHTEACTPAVGGQIVSNASETSGSTSERAP